MQKPQGISQHCMAGVSGGHPGGAEQGVLGESCSPNPHPPVPKSAASSWIKFDFQFHAAAGAILDLPPRWLVSQLDSPRHSQAYGKGENPK